MENRSRENERDWVIRGRLGKMSKTLARAICAFATAIVSFQKPYRRVLSKALASENLRQTVEIQTPHGLLRFDCATARATHDPLGFGRDEPETVHWIDNYVAAGEIVWDIGANIGLYTLYAASKPGVGVIAFEPSAATFASLVRNIELNRLGHRVQAFCIALAGRTGIDLLHMANTGAGHSMHAFGQLQTVEGKLHPSFSQAALGFSIDDFVKVFGIEPPHHIKLDVDSIEEQILRGGQETLQRVKTVLVESVPGPCGLTTLLKTLGFKEEPQPPGRNRLFTNPAALSTL